MDEHNQGIFFPHYYSNFFDFQKRVGETSHPVFTTNYALDTSPDILMHPKTIVSTSHQNFSNSIKITEDAVVQRCSLKKVFLEISQNSQEKNCARVSFLIKRDSGTDVFL